MLVTVADIKAIIAQEENKKAFIASINNRLIELLNNLTTL